MTILRTTASVAALCLALGAGIASASATPMNVDGCRQLDQQVQRALDAAAGSANVSAAMSERHAGNASCMAGFYKLGQDHLNKALALLKS
jgi:hypothetical protein